MTSGVHDESKKDDTLGMLTNVDQTFTIIRAIYFLEHTFKQKKYNLVRAMVLPTVLDDKLLEIQSLYSKEFRWLELSAVEQPVGVVNCGNQHWAIRARSSHW